jgi:hypothetical protein
MAALRRDHATAQAALVIGAAVGVAAAGWWFLYPALLWIAPIVIAIDLGQSRDRTGWMWGAFLGWLGVIILAIMRPRPKAAA